ncbi:LacI family DNA-binding transcriptional regulator [Streptomyces olivaceus]|uniref:LacI family DNA-binding transcriptional regulator n=1 Tax=Streptomyces olivaceus TaxID=47716 RepID=UPI0004CA560D|nr:LacI family DNA-binding transcriptional regulator [Streptomyces olivaceus]
MTRRLAQVAKKVGVSEATVSRVLNGKPGVSQATQQQVSGVVFAGGGLFAQADAPHDHYRLLAERNIPVVLVNASIPDLGFPCVACDDAVAVGQSWRHLASLGHERIGLVLGPSDHIPSRRKLAAARQTAEATDAALPDTHVERAMFSLEGGQAAATRLLDRGVTGVICASDPLALGAVRAARRRGLHVPHDVSVVGYDDSAFMTCTEPPLTTVRQPIEAMGRAAVDLLCAQIQGTEVPHRELLFEPELVVRGSTAQASGR